MDALPRVGWIGAGRMGSAMGGFLLQAGYPLRVWSPSAASRQRLVAPGAAEAADARDAAAGAALVFTCVSDDQALAQVCLGDGGVLAAMDRGAILIDTSTVSAAVSATVQEAAAAAGVDYLRAPISGNAASARRGEVTVMVSGPAPAWERARPALAAVSRAQVYLGGGEEARHMKLVVNALVINMAQAMAEAFALGRASGLDWALMLDTVAQSTVASPWVKAKAALLKTRDFSPTMTGRLILKDVDLMLAEARTRGVPMPLTAGTRQLLQALVGEGMGDEDYMALVKMAERQSGLAAPDHP